jgi:DNA-binding MarR family transcriptional regulator
MCFQKISGVLIKLAIAARAVPKREEIRQKISTSHFQEIFHNEPDHDFSPDELKVRMEATGMTFEIATIIKYIRHAMTNGMVRLVPLDEKNRYRHVPSDLSEQFCGLNDDHHRFYAFIEQAQDQGIWRKELKRRTGIDEKEIAALVGDLKKRQLIKEVPSVAEKRIKYFLFHINPSDQVTGGIWVSDRQFNSTLIDETLMPAVAQCVAAHPGVSMSELVRRVKTSGFGNLRYEDPEAEQLVTATLSSGGIAREGGVFRIPPRRPRFRGDLQMWHCHHEFTPVGPAATVLYSDITYV